MDATTGNIQHYLSLEFKKIVNDEGARIHNSPVYTGAGNAVAESFNKGIELKTVAMLRDGCAPEEAWELAAEYSLQIRNMVTVNSKVRPELQHSNPYTLWHDGTKPNIEFVRKFWSRAVPLQHGKRIGSLDEQGRGKPGVFVYVGLAGRSEGANFLDLTC